MRACVTREHSIIIFFFFNDTATTEIYTLSLHDALPICYVAERLLGAVLVVAVLADQALLHHGDLLAPGRRRAPEDLRGDRKSTRLNSSHSQISYAVFCLKKKTVPNGIFPVYPGISFGQP